MLDGLTEYAVAAILDNIASKDQHALRAVSRRYCQAVTRHLVPAFDPSEQLPPEGKAIFGRHRDSISTLTNSEDGADLAGFLKYLSYTPCKRVIFHMHDADRGSAFLQALKGNNHCEDLSLFVKPGVPIPLSRVGLPQLTSLTLNIPNGTLVADLVKEMDCPNLASFTTDSAGASEPLLEALASSFPALERWSLHHRTDPLGGRVVFDVVTFSYRHFTAVMGKGFLRYEVDFWPAYTWDPRYSETVRESFFTRYRRVKQRMDGLPKLSPFDSFSDMMRVKITSHLLTQDEQANLLRNLAHAAEITLAIRSIAEIHLPLVHFRATQLAIAVEDHFSPEFMAWLTHRFPDLRHLRLVPGSGQPCLDPRGAGVLANLGVFATTPEAACLMNYIVECAPSIKRVDWVLQPED